MTDPAEDAIVVALLQQLLEDRDAGRPHGLAYYQARFPGYEALVQREFESMDEEPPPVEHPRYAARTELGRGAMGVVHRVYDREMRRSLAMKVMASDAGAHAHSRFADEARITGQLSHPGVVPVHDFGIDGAGQAFFTMSEVRGRTLRDVIDAVHDDDDEWTLPRALGVLARVCEAVAFAHSRGVIHRDLKPANVMVGEFGETYVMDWGLARVIEQPGDDAAIESYRRELDDDSPLLTMDGDVLGTPAYMAPEQARGQAETVDGSADIYAIGAMLYHLLAGSIPYSEVGSSSREVLDEVVRHAPRSLRTERDIPAELIAICERAMAREPSERYRSAAALAEDLRAFLELRVVHAYETGALAEIRKWIARNKLAAAALLSAVLALVVGLVTSEVQRGRADENARRAAEQSERAEDNFRLAFDAVDRMLTRVGDQRLAQVPQAREVQHELLRDALAFHQRFLEDRAGDPTLRAEVAAAHTRLGTILRTLGRFDDSKQHLDRAIAMLEAQRLENPEDLEILRDFVVANNALAATRADSGETELALELFRTAVTGLEQLIAAAPGDLELRRRRARVLHNIGTTLHRDGQFEAALASWEQSLAGYREVYERSGELDDRFKVARSIGGVAYGLRGVKRSEEAVAAYRDCITRLDELLEIDPDNRSYREVLAMNLLNLGAAAPAEADKLDALHRGRDVYEALIRDYPAVPEYRYLLGGVYSNLGDHIARTDRKRGIELIRTALDHERHVLRTTPDDVRAQAFYKSQMRKLLRHLLNGSEYLAATASADELATMEFSGPAELILAARTFARAARLIDFDKELDEATHDELWSEYVERSIEILEFAKAKGIRNPRSLEHKFFDAVRDDPRFVEISRQR